jgi:hypothetical protein
VATYLEITNEVLRRLNEVTIAQDDFPNVRNIQALAKDAINASIRGILQSAQEWPFTLVTYTETLVSGTREYSFPADASSVDWESFYLKELTAEGNYPTKLDVISYTEYLDRFRAQDDTNGTEGFATPTRVFQTQELKFGVTPIPNAAYELEYKYWSFPSDLTAFDDTPVIPDRFRHVIIDGAMAYMMRFRSNEQSAMIHQNNYSDGIAIMRRLLMDEPINMRSTYIIPTGFQRVISR